MGGTTVARMTATIALVMLFVFLVVLAVLTIHQHDYLDDLGWSPVHRTPVEWPSLLATGSGGWMLSTTFLLSGLSVLGLAAGIRNASDARRRTPIGLAVAVMGIGLCLITFTADRPDVASESWHASIHNTSYPLIPLGGIIACALLASEPRSSFLRTGSRVLLPILLITFAATNLDDIAQLARYFAFASLLAWTACVAVAVRADAAQPKSPE